MNSETYKNEVFRKYYYAISNFTKALEIYKSYCKPNYEVLDVACGPGNVTFHICDEVKSVLGIDLSEGFIDDANNFLSKNQAIRNVNFQIEDMRAFNLNKKFDLITLGGNAIHELIEAKDQLSCFENIANHLKKEGKFIFSVHLLSEKFLTKPAVTNSVDYKIEGKLYHLDISYDWDIDLPRSISSGTMNIEISKDGFIEKKLSLPANYSFMNHREVIYLLKCCGFKVVTDMSYSQDPNYWAARVFVCELE